MDGFIYIFAVIGIAVTGAAAAMGVAVTVVMARLTYSRLMSVVPTLFAPVGVVGEQKLEVSHVSHDPLTSYAEKTRITPGSNGGRKPIKDLEIAISK